MFSKMILALTFILIGCAAGRMRGDEEAERLTGVRSMVGDPWCGTCTSCLAPTIDAAKKDCAAEGKTYQYKNHECSTAFIVKYACESKSSDMAK